MPGSTSLEFEVYRGLGFRGQGSGFKAYSWGLGLTVVDGLNLAPPRGPSMLWAGTGYTRWCKTSYAASIACVPVSLDILRNGTSGAMLQLLLRTHGSCKQW